MMTNVPAGHGLNAPLDTQTALRSEGSKGAIKRALISVSDKAGLVDFVAGLAARGVEIVSTGGTAKALSAAGIKVRPIDDVTGFPEIMDGRVKTLHPKVHGGLLGVRDNAQHRAQAAEHGIEPIDLVCVNLYPFEETVATPGVTQHDAIENIDIGGPSMLRSAAKNFAFVTVVTSSDQYRTVLDEMDAHDGGTTLATRAAFAAKVFETTARYDGAIAAYLAENVAGTAKSGIESLPAEVLVALTKVSDLRYGENPHQSAAVYRSSPGGLFAAKGPSVGSAKQLHGKELSYNNINDAAAALDLVAGFSRLGGFGACVVKHTNPCGAAIASGEDDPAERAVSAAIAGDPVAAYGGILAVNGVIDGRAAEKIAGKDRFFEVVIAPGYTEEGLGVLRARWANVRLLDVGAIAVGNGTGGGFEMRTFAGGVLIQERDTLFTVPSEIKHAAGPVPTAEQIRAAAFLEVVGRGLFSNAVVIGGADPERTGTVRMFGGGAGQMDRVTSCRIAIEKSGTLSHGAVVYSDAFFPFADGPSLLAAAGVKCIVHPGGSKRDQDTFDLCNAQGICCLLTGTRHFRH